MAKTEKILCFKTFDEAIQAAASYRKLGIMCEIRSWEQTKDGNLLHIFEDDEWWKVWES